MRDLNSTTHQERQQLESNYHGRRPAWPDHSCNYRESKEWTVSSGDEDVWSAQRCQAHESKQPQSTCRDLKTFQFTIELSVPSAETC